MGTPFFPYINQVSVWSPLSSKQPQSLDHVVGIFVVGRGNPSFLPMRVRAPEDISISVCRPASRSCKVEYQAVGGTGLPRVVEASLASRIVWLPYNTAFRNFHLFRKQKPNPSRGRVRFLGY